MNLKKIVKRDQEQAIASWVNYLNQVRLERLMDSLQHQDENYNDAIKILNDSLKIINTEIIEKNRGGLKGMHGFIAEVAECGVVNARERIEGRMPICEWINDNGPIDFTRQGIPIQQKFVASGNHLSLQAIVKHFEKYPEFIKQGGKYQIPTDHYEKIQYLLSLSEEEANKMSTSTGEFSLKQWEEVHKFFTQDNIKLKDIEASTLNYDQVQMNKIGDTIEKEKTSLQEVDKEIRENAYNFSKPSLAQGLKATAASSAIEGSVTLILEIQRKCKSGKRIGEFDSSDWNFILKKAGIGSVKGGIRGISIYTLTNYTATPAAVASSLCTASFGIAEQAYLLRNGKITQKQFMLNSELLCVETSVSALSSILGHVLIPIPVLGAVIGNTVGIILYQIVKENFTKNEINLVKDYLKDLHKLEADMNKQYSNYIKELNEGLVLYYNVLQKAFSPNYEEALKGSIDLAMFVGVEEDEILQSIQDIDRYFMD